ncbi:glycoside hydrolase family protein [Serratia ureilytica]
MVIIGLVLSNGEVKTSKAGLELIGNAEGCRRDPYKCPADVWTDGVGNTHEVKPVCAKPISRSLRTEKEHLAAERALSATRQAINPGGDAAVSITFNVGCPAMQKSTMFQLFRQGRQEAACDQFPRCVRQWRKLNGLRSGGTRSALYAWQNDCLWRVISCWR